MIDKITPRALDKSSDHKLVPKTSMIDALNMYISEDSIDEEGNSGILKNIKGNKNVEYGIGNDYPINPGVGFKVIGSVTDSLTHICYFFVWSEDARDHGVWAYDKYGKLPQGAGTSPSATMGIENSIRKIFTSSQFNFPQHGFVKGDIVHKSGSEFYRRDIQLGEYDFEAIAEAIIAYSELNGFFPEIDYATDSLGVEQTIFADDSLNIRFPSEEVNLYPNHIEWFDNPRRSKLKGEFERDAILYFTDNENEPRKINIYRALLNQLTHIGGYDAISVADFICACPKTPLDRISFEFSPDLSRSVNNFSTSPGFQFAYQNIYIDGAESAISTYSQIAFPPSVLNRGAAQTSNLLGHNLCTLTLPVLGAEIESIRILARYGNTSNFFEIDEVKNKRDKFDDNNLWDHSTRKYKFYNDRVGFGVSPKEVDKTFDNLPRKAQAQTTISNRLVYGNYVEGYDNVETSCSSQVIYNPRPIDFLDLVIKAHPAIEPTPFGDNKTVGFQIDTTEIPPTVPKDTVIQVALDYTPHSNFHLYQAHNTSGTVGSSYHQSRQVGKYSSNANGYRHWPLTHEHNFFFEEGESEDDVDGFNFTHGTENSPSPADLQEQGFPSEDAGFNIDSWGTKSGSGGAYLTKGEPFFGQNYGVGAKADESLFDLATPGNINDLPLWRVTNSHGSAAGIVDFENGHKARYGTSAGNPLILKQAPLRFEVKFKVVESIVGNAKSVVAAIITEALAGADGVPFSEGGGGVFTYDEFIENGVCEEVVNTVRVTKDQYDLGLGYDPENIYNSNFSFPSFAQNDDLSQLVCGLGALDHTDTTIGDLGNFWGLGAQELIPFGFFIINRAEVDFYLEQVGGDHQDGKHMRLCISKIDVEQEDIMTCIRRLDPRSPWWAVHPSTIQDTTFAGQFSASNGGNGDLTIWDTTGVDGSSEAELWQSSFPYKFKLPDPLFHEGHPAFVNPYKWFIAMFDVSSEVTDFDAQLHEGPNFFNTRWVNLGFCGYLDISSANHPHIYKPHNTDNSDYIPRRGLSKFKFSLMDGEGGPGGISAGGNAAYDKYGNTNFGSIAGRVDFGYDGSSVSVSRYNIGNGEHLYQAMVGGSGLDSGDEIVTIGMTPAGTGNAGVGIALGLDDSTEGENILYREKYVVSGPFFTGSIAMNPVVGNDLVTDAANTQNPFPPIKDYTTTLPLIWVNSGQVTLGTSSTIPLNWLNTSYPWPQVIRNASLPFTDSSGFITNAEIDEYPFFNPQFYPSDAEWGDPTSVMDLDIDPIIENHTSPPDHNHFGCVDFSKFHSHIDGQSQSSYISGFGEENFSFKTSATHEFGIVYYDQRGRHGYVNHLDSVYVEGYSPQKRGYSLQGSAHIQLSLKHSPPSWAHNYKIAYSKNTSVSDFIQYSAGGAFVAEGESTAGDPSKIYVSLNYLQGHPISYSSAWGARSKEGSMAIYTPQEGDRLRVISHMMPPSSEAAPTNIYPFNYEFEVSGVVSLDDSEQNPLSYINDSETIVDENRQGLFIILKNNNSASGFRYQDVRDAVHNWGNNCIVEIFSPVKELDPEDRLYYEIGKTYKVLRQENADGEAEYVHEENNVLLTEGDVYFRNTAVNLRDYNTDLNDTGLIGYEDIIINTEPDDIETAAVNEFRTSESNFKSYYLESPVGTDLFKSDAISIGRPNIIKHDASENRKLASVIHSDKDIIDSSKVSYSSFNRSIPIDQDLDIKGGEINYLTNHGENCFFVQKNKCGYIPIDRNIISDVSGESSLIASSKFFNTPKYYAGRAGADGNPESVVSVDSTAYFAHKTLGEVYKVSGANGVQIISEINMKSYFRDLFQTAMAKSFDGAPVRVVGGYDPLKSEYLLTVLNPGRFADRSELPPVERPNQLESPEIIYGCTDSLSDNYNPEATVSDGSCTYVYGCMNPASNNYDPAANVNDNNCVSNPDIFWFNPCFYPQLFSNAEGENFERYITEGSIEIAFDAAREYENSLDFEAMLWQFQFPIQNWQEFGPANFGGLNASMNLNAVLDLLSSGNFSESLAFYCENDVTQGVSGGAGGAETQGIPGGNGGNLDYNGSGSSTNGGGGLPPTVPPPTVPPPGLPLAQRNTNSRAQTQPLPFTGNLCDYDMLIDPLTSAITAESITHAFNLLRDIVESNDGEGISPYNSDGYGGLVALTHLFPNFANGTTEWPGLVGQGTLIPSDPSLDGFYNTTSGAWVENFPTMNFESYGGNWFNGSDLISALATLNPEWYTVQNGIVTGGPQSNDTLSLLCVSNPEPTLEYTGNLCDYPILADNNGIISLDSVLLAYGDVVEMMGLNESDPNYITMAEATFVFPDLSGDGQIQIQDLVDAMLLESNILCNGPVPPSQNICDYPLLVNDQGLITVQSISDAVSFVTNGIEQGDFSSEYGTSLLPDSNNDGFITANDILSLLQIQLPVNCGEGIPGIVKPLKYKQISSLTSAKDLAVKQIKNKRKKDNY